MLKRTPKWMANSRDETRLSLSLVNLVGVSAFWKRFREKCYILILRRIRSHREYSPRKSRANSLASRVCKRLELCNLLGIFYDREIDTVNLEISF